MENSAATTIPASTGPSIAELASQMDAGINQNTDGQTTETPPAETERLAAKFAEAARRNQALRAKQRQLKAPLAEKETRVAELEKELERLKKYEDITDPMELLKLKGMSYEDLIARNLNPEEHDSKAEIQALREELESYKKSAEEKEKTNLERQNEEVVSGYIKHITKFVADNSEKYELINTLGHQQDVYETIVEMHKKTGKVISDEEAADLVEKFLMDQTEKQLDQFSKTSKLKSKFAPITDENQQGDLYSQSPTLTNQLSAQTTATKQNLSDEELLKRAASFIKWTN